MMMPGMDDMALNDAALEQALGGVGPMPPDPAGGECPLCAGPVDPETGMSLAAAPPPVDPAMMPPGGGMPGMV